MTRQQLDDIKITVTGAEGPLSVPLARFVLKNEGIVPKTDDKPGKPSGGGFMIFLVIGVAILLVAVGLLAWQRIRVSQVKGVRRNEGEEMASNSDYSMLSSNNSRDMHLEEENMTLRKKNV